MSPAPDPQDLPEQPHLREEWLCELFAPAREVEGRPSTGDEPRPPALVAAEGHVRALRSLPRLEAPAELDGRVVASLEAGFRQDRAADHVAGLPRVGAPEELTERVAAEVGRGLEAPAVLDRLVAERVEAPAQGMVRSMAGRLERKQAPAELDERVLRSEPGPSRRLRRVAVALGAAAVVLLLVRFGQPGLGPVDPARPQLRITRIDSLESVSASALDRAFLGALTGEYPGGAR
ncbi:MAG: hypothetical protein PVJ89_06075 [Planctomycetota bacterium]|jgi:hypothetical protein